MEGHAGHRSGRPSCGIATANARPSPRVPRGEREHGEAARETSEAPAVAAERIAYGVLVAATEEDLVKTLEHVLDVLRRSGAPAGPLGEVWPAAQEQHVQGGHGP